MEKTRFLSVDEYISSQPASHRPGLKQLRQTIRKAAPQAEEVISYNMPAYKFQGILVYFAAHTAHIGFYALPGPLIAFKEKLKSYTTSKGTVQFPLGKALPVKLIQDMVLFRVKENLERKSLKRNIQGK
jgi:uncharacterized protein YdhG (YjbR/CyaY superfamily)